MLVHCRHHIDYKGNELEIIARSLPGSEQLGSTVGTEAPVIVLAGAVYPCKRLFVK